MTKAQLTVRARARNLKRRALTVAYVVPSYLRANANCRRVLDKVRTRGTAAALKQATPDMVTIVYDTTMIIARARAQRAAPTCPARF